MALPALYFPYPTRELFDVTGLSHECPDQRVRRLEFQLRRAIPKLLNRERVTVNCHLHAVWHDS